MARMWPRKLPGRVRNARLRSAECLIYDRLAEVLDDEWVVFYSRPWMGLSTSGEEIDGEADFVVAHPEFGLLTVEVKGGAVAYDARQDRWTSTDRYGVIHDIKDPVQQARSAKYNILKLLGESSHWAPHWIRARHGVVFPNVQLSNAALGADRPRRIFADKDQVQDALADWTVARLKAPEADDRAEGRPLGEDGIRALEKILAAPFHLRVPLGQYLDDDDREIDLLTERQYQVLSLLNLIPRVAIRGAAGTGKTVLAMEAARRAHDEGKRVLLSCYNVALAAVLQKRLGTDVNVQSFHALCGAMAAKANLSVGAGHSASELYENVLPTLLADAAEALPQVRYDLIVVDEAQDFRSHWWPALDALLAPGGRLIVFHDTNQKVYGNINSLPADISAVPVALDQNLRNTKQIHELVMRHYGGEAVKAGEVIGQKPEALIAVAGPGLVDRCARLVSRLVDVEGIAPDDVFILVSTDAEKRNLTGQGLLGRYPVKACDQGREGAVTVDTVRRFKGLEGRVVVLLASPALATDTDLAYVATSRARVQLIGVGDAPSMMQIGFVVPNQDVAVTTS